MEKESAVFYVSTVGNDGWSGTLPDPDRAGADGPFATIARARDAIRELKARAPLGQPITVFLRGGTYWLTEPITFAPEDSGTDECPITYAAYPGETPIISGGRTITGWERAERYLWSAPVPAVKEGAWHFRQLFVNGQRRQRARLPGEGFFQVVGDISLDERATFQFKPGDIEREWCELADVEVVALQAWAELRMQIRAVDEAAHSVTLSGKCAPSNRESNARYWVENAPEGLDAPGKWYLDARSGTVYYWPLPGEGPANVEVVAPVLLETLVRFEGDPERGDFVRHLHLRGLTFSHCRWTLGPKGYADVQAAYDIPGAIVANGAVSCSIEDCVLSHLGGYAIEFARGCKDNHILACEMTDLGAGGVKIGEPHIRQAEAELTGGNTVADCHIHDIGIVYPAAVGVWIGQSSGNHIAHNHIHDTFYTGISVGWTWGYGPTNARDNVIEFNHVHHISRGMLSDLGGIYTLGVQPGTVIRNNVFHDIFSYGYGGWGIYTDEGSSDILIENNVVYRTKSGGFHQHYGRENIVRNNVFAFAKEGQIIRSRQEPHLSFTFERNIVYWDEGQALGGNWGDDKYRLDYNLYWDARGTAVRLADWSFDEWQKRGQDVHSLIADPLFVDPHNGDFTLRPGSPALRLGFQPIDVGCVGVRRGRGEQGHSG